MCVNQPPFYQQKATQEKSDSKSTIDLEFLEYETGNGSFWKFYFLSGIWRLGCRCAALFLVPHSTV